MVENNKDQKMGKAAVGDLDSFGLQPTSFVLTTEGDVVEAAQGFAPDMINDKEEDQDADSV